MMYFICEDATDQAVAAYIGDCKPDLESVLDHNALKGTKHYYRINGKWYHLDDLYIISAADREESKK